MKKLVLVAIVCLIAGGAPLRAGRQSDGRFVTLCKLMLKPGNAFTYVRPPERQMAEAAEGAAPAATINVTYVGFAAKPGAQAAYQFAVSIWSSLLTSPQSIQVRAEFTTLGPGQLGAAGANISHFNVLGTIPNTFYGDPLADRLSGEDQNPGEFDILSEFSDTANWYFGTDGNVPPGQVDFVSVVLHELGHGLGFAGSAYYNVGLGGVGSGGIPDIFDRFVETESAFPILGFQNDSAALGTQLTQGYNAGNPHGPGLYWGGALGKAANGGVTPRMYTPSTWSGGSSYSHLDEDVFPAGNPNSLMTFQLQSAEAVHSPGPITVGILNDVAWQSQPELIVNGNFTAAFGLPWETFDGTDIVHNSAVNGQFEYRRASPTTLSGQAVILQKTSTAFGANEQLLATWRMGNSASVRRRFSVLIWSTDFSDLHVCTFWMPPFAPMLQYQMLTHTTKAWPAAQIHFYAASSGAGGGNYQLDDVSLKAAPVPSPVETRCIDPWFALATPDSDSAELVQNGNFSIGGNPPASWNPFNQEVHQLTSGVYEFARNTGAVPAGGVLQHLPGPIAAESIVTARFQLGNSSTVRKRVTLLLNDAGFSDLSACTFWLQPGQPLTPYLMRTYVSNGMPSPDFTLYVATEGPEHWILLDNVSVVITPSTQTFGTECGEPKSALVANGNVPIDGASAAAAAKLRSALRSPKPKPAPAPTRPSSARPRTAPSTDRATSEVNTLVFTAAAARPRWLISVPPAVTAVPTFTRIQVSDDGVNWRTVARIRTPQDWDAIALDLDDLLPPEDTLYVRFVLEGR